jgi:asparagine synthase (glutamine-hydrolysing)
MCGIAGWVNFEKDLTKESLSVERMGRSLAHRGPDADGIWLSPQAAFAHRRLIVIDPEAGAQPMVFKKDGREYVITFNGEIYNFKDLRHRLSIKGHQFKTKSDTEVLLHAYVEWGHKVTEHLNGIFAFGIWDEAKQSLLLARDHLGVKPLFYAQRGSSMLFGSELKAILAHPEVRSVLSEHGMAQIFGRLMVHVPGATVYEDIFEVPAAHRLIFERGGARLERYWQLQSAPHTDDLNTTVMHIRELLQDTVAHQLVADVPVSTMLSGGLDSSGITALAAREFKRLGKTINSYSIDFVNHERDFKPNFMHLDLDTPWARKVSEYSGTSQHMVVIDYPDLLENILVPTMAHDKPGLGQMETSLYLLCKAMKQGATVALSGESADEVFGGYPWFHDREAAFAQTFPWMAMMNQNIAPNYLSKDLNSRFDISHYVAQRYDEALAEVPRLAGEGAVAARRREVLYLNQTRFLPILLDRKDRMSMAVGFEVRVPFCDYRLVEYVWNIPWEMKTTGDIEKGVLRRALEDVLPHDVLYRRKSPYPATQNPAYAAGVRERALEILNNPNAKIRPYFDVAALKTKAEDSITANAAGDHMFSPFEHLVQIEGWLERYKAESV